MPAVQPPDLDAVRSSPSVGLARTTPLRVEPRAATPPRQAQSGWISSGLYVMTLPMAITVGMMLAPVIWMFGVRPRES